MAIITGPDGTPLTVDSASLAIRGTPYAYDGEPATRRYTYASCTVAKNVLTGSATVPLATIYGAAGRIIRLVRFRGCFTVATTAVYNALTMRKVVGSLHPTGGTTSTSLSGRVPYDSMAPRPLAKCTVWSTGPSSAPMTMTPPTLFTACGSVHAYVPVTSSPVREPGVFLFTWDGTRNPALKGDSEGFEFIWAAAFGTTLTGTVEIIWTEEPANG